MGTFDHCNPAPEILELKPRIGIKAEIYSLGVLLYTMLVGRAPYKSKVSAFGDPTDIYKNLVE